MTLPVQGVEFLDTQKAALLLGVSRNLIYHLINTGKLIAYNLSIRRTIILRKDIDLLFQRRTRVIIPGNELPLRPKIEDCYYVGEIQAKFNISEKALYDLIKRNNIAKFQMGRFTYVSKKVSNEFSIRTNVKSNYTKKNDLKEQAVFISGLLSTNT